MDERFTYLVEKYLDHNLSKEEQKEFDAFLKVPGNKEYLIKAEKAEKIIEEGFKHIITKLENDLNIPKPDELNDEIEEAIKTYQGITSKEAKNIITQLKQKHRRVNYSILGLAATILIASLILFLPFKSKPTNRDLYFQFYKPYEFLITRSLTDTCPAHKKAIQKYMQSDYIASANDCKKILDDYCEELLPRFLYALNLLALDSIPQAMEQFNTIIKNNSGTSEHLIRASHWYKGLCFLYLDKRKETLIELESLKEGGYVLGKEMDLEGLVREIGGV